MKYKIVTLLLLSIKVYSQVGINTDTPNATLEVHANPTELIPDGIISPILTGDQLQAKNKIYLADQIGAIVYVISPVTGNREPKTIDVNTAGYYFFNGTKWEKMNSSEIEDTSIYNGDGSLTSNRIVNQGANTISFNSSATTGTSHFNIDGNTFNVNAVNNKVGIGTDNPSEKLDVRGKIKLTELGDYNSSSSIPLVWDSNTNTISRGSSDSEKSFYTLQLNVNTSANQDWIENFDTKIPSDKYQVLITSAQFRKRTNSSLAYIKYYDNSITLATPLLNIASYVQSGTWRLRADYLAATPGVEGDDYYWVIDLLIINNSLVNQSTGKTGSVNSSGVGSLESSPIP